MILTSENNYYKYKNSPSGRLLSDRPPKKSRPAQNAINGDGGREKNYSFSSNYHKFTNNSKITQSSSFI